MSAAMKVPPGMPGPVLLLRAADRQNGASLKMVCVQTRKSPGERLPGLSFFDPVCGLSGGRVGLPECFRLFVG